MMLVGRQKGHAACKTSCSNSLQNFFYGSGLTWV